MLFFLPSAVDCSSNRQRSLATLAAGENGCLVFLGLLAIQTKKFCVLHINWLYTFQFLHGNRNESSWSLFWFLKVGES